MSNINNQSQNLYSVAKMQELLTLNSLLEEISDDNSASLTGGARSTFVATIPDIGSGTSRTYTTTSQFNDISIRLNENINYPIFVRAVRADGRGSVSSSSRRIPPNSKGELIIVAANVRDGVNFKLDFLIQGRNSRINVSGPISF